MKEEIRICGYCGREYSTIQPGAGHKYCSVECGYQANMRQQAERNHRRSEERAARKAELIASGQYHRKKYVRKSKKVNKNLHALAAEASAAGLSYGMYVAMTERGARYEQRNREVDGAGAEAG